MPDDELVASVHTDQTLAPGDVPVERRTRTHALVHVCALPNRKICRAERAQQSGLERVARVLLAHELARVDRVELHARAGSRASVLVYILSAHVQVAPVGPAVCRADLVCGLVVHAGTSTRVTACFRYLVEKLLVPTAGHAAFLGEILQIRGRTRRPAHLAFSELSRAHVHAPALAVDHVVVLGAHFALR